MADADAELGDEIKPPVKIGHSDSQQLAQNSGFVDPTPGEMPAVGWMENVRVNDDGTKLLADLKAVPKKLAEIIEAGGYRTRSVELSKVTSQATGKVYDWVVTGLAWLGGKMPAVRTLDDVVSLYEGDGVELLRRVAYAAGAVVWSAAEGLSAIRALVSEALNGEPSDGMCDPRFYVRDIAPGKALVEDWYEDASLGRAWVVPYTVGADGATVAPREEWVTAEQQWVEAAKQYEQAVTGRFRVRSDTGGQMPVKTDLKLNDEQRRVFADALNVKPEDLTDEKLLEALEPEPEGDKPGDGAKPEGEKPEGDEAAKRALEAKEREFETRLADAEKNAKDAQEKLRLTERRHFIESLVETGKVEPGQRGKWEARYDKDPEMAREFAAELQANDILAREYGSNDDTDEEQRELEEKAERERISREYNIPVEEVV